MTEIVQHHGLEFGAHVELVRFEPEAVLPSKAYRMSAAWDLSAYTGKSIVTIPPSTTKLIPTGIGMRAPKGHLLLICSRSGLGLKSIFVSNAPGVVDPDYTGEMKVLLYNGSSQPYYVRNGDRVAQVLLVPFANVPLREVATMPVTERGDRGFGSSGT